MKKGVFALTLFICSLMLVSAEGMTHYANEICVEINGYNVSLQEALVNNWFNSFSEGTPTSNECSGYGMHHANNILINNSDGSVMTLQEAATYAKLNGGSFSSLVDMIPNGHISEEIIFSNAGAEKTLKEVLSDEEACSVVDCNEYCGSVDGGCGENINCGGCIDSACQGNVCVGVCTPGNTATKDCDGSDTTCRDYHDVTKTCLNTGYWNNPPCGYTDASRGTTCETWKACDGAGSCVGYSGTGCGGCPSGSNNNFEGSGAATTCYAGNTHYTLGCSSPSGSWTGSGGSKGASTYCGSETVSVYCAGLTCTHRDSYGSCDSYSLYDNEWSIIPS